MVKFDPVMPLVNAWFEFQGLRVTREELGPLNIACIKRHSNNGKGAAARANKRRNLDNEGEPMLSQQWLFIGVFLILAPIFPALALVIPKIIAPRKPNRIKMETYECGDRDGG